VGAAGRRPAISPGTTAATADRIGPGANPATAAARTATARTMERVKRGTGLLPAGDKSPGPKGAGDGRRSCPPELTWKPVE